MLFYLPPPFVKIGKKPTLDTCFSQVEYIQWQIYPPSYWIFSGLIATSNTQIKGRPKSGEGSWLIRRNVLKELV